MITYPYVILEAGLLTIKKWEMILDGTYPDLGYWNCAYCALYADGDGQSMCRDRDVICPIVRFVNPCRYTAYHLFRKLCADSGTDYADTTGKRAIAKQELDILRYVFRRILPLVNFKKEGNRSKLKEVKSILRSRIRERNRNRNHR